MGNIYSTPALALPSRARIFILEGLPGCGKTMFIRSAASYWALWGYHVRVFTEDIDAEFLAAYLANQERYAFAFQTNLTHQRVYQHARARELVERDPLLIVFLDRSRIGDFAFARELNARGAITDAEFAFYRTASGLVRGTTLASLHPRTDFVVLYLRVTAAKSLERVRKRGNASEVGGYTLKSMSTLLEHYERTIDACRPIVVDVDWNADLALERRFDYHENCETEQLPAVALEAVFNKVKFMTDAERIYAAANPVTPLAPEVAAESAPREKNTI
jgi:deoxyadenosine/deoxycytidine kinase